MPLEEELSSIQTQLAKEIKTKLIERDLTQVEIARMLGTSRMAVSRAISGDTTPHSKQIRQKIYKILGMEDGNE